VVVYCYGADAFHHGRGLVSAGERCRGLHAALTAGSGLATCLDNAG
jgi:hypothetical protein